MQLFQKFLCCFYVVFMMLLTSFFWSNFVFADISQTIRLVAVFDYEDTKLHGDYDVVVRVYIDDGDNVDLEYSETVYDVEFFYGVGYIEFGGSGTDLINADFDDPDFTIRISVNQHQLEFPLTSIPYSIRSLEANQARRLDDESIMIFLEDDQRVGINLLDPEVTLDVSGSIRIQDILNSDTVENGVLYWDGNNNEFYVYTDSGWSTLSYWPDESIRSKWTYYSDTESLVVTTSVGINESPGSYALAVAEDTMLYGDLDLDGFVNISGNLMTSENEGFVTESSLIVSSIQLSSDNYWNDGDFVFSGTMYGDGSELTNLNNFVDGLFESSHIADYVVEGDMIQDDSIYAAHFSDGVIGIENVEKNQISGDYLADDAIDSDSIIDASIQTHHMQKTQISSSNLYHNSFNKEKITDNAILADHIVDGLIDSSKIAYDGITSINIADSSISSAQILDGAIESRHIENGGISLSFISDILDIDAGGTGQSEFDEYGVVYINSNSIFESNSDEFMIENGRMGIGGSTDDSVLLQVSDDSFAQMSVISDFDYVSSMTFSHSIASWNIQVNEDGVLEFIYGDDALLAISYEGNVGIGTSNPSEVLSLAGEIVLGDALSTTEGTIKYVDDQFFARTATEWHPLNESSVALRTFDIDEMSNLAQSSVIYSEGNTLAGSNQWVESVLNSSMIGDYLSGVMLNDSFISGLYTSLRNGIEARIHGDFIDVSQARQSQLNGSWFRGHQINHSIVDGDFSNIWNVKDSEMSVSFASITGAHQSFGTMLSSSVSFIDSSNIYGDWSMIGFLNDSDLISVKSIVQQASNIVGDLYSSSLLNSEDLNISLSNSFIQGAKDSTISGQDIVVFGGDGHQIESNSHISLIGDYHSIRGKRSIAIGDNISINHHDATLINASDYPLESDANGQLKIQADGGIVIEFSPSSSISMVDGGGSWSNISDRNLKTSLVDVDVFDVLDKVRTLPIHYWQYKSQLGTQHIGPTAQDFYDIFQYGNSSKVIHSIDSDGILLAAIQGLSQRVSYISDLLDNHSESMTLTNDKLIQIQQKISLVKEELHLLSVLYNENDRLLDQFNKDYEDQSKMLKYLDVQIRRAELNLMFDRLDSYLMISGLVLFGVLLGSLICFIKVRRFNT